MSNFVPEKVFLRGVLLYYFNMKKTAAESHRILVEVYGEHSLAERMCQKWFARFKSGDFGLEDEDVLGSRKSLKMKNWKYYSMKIVAKHKKSSQNFSIRLLLVNSWKFSCDDLLRLLTWIIKTRVHRSTYFHFRQWSPILCHCETLV